MQKINRSKWTASLPIMTNSSNMTLCNVCKTNQAEIFQESGDFCYLVKVSHTLKTIWTQ